MPARYLKRFTSLGAGMRRAGRFRGRLRLVSFALARWWDKLVRSQFLLEWLALLAGKLLKYGWDFRKYGLTINFSVLLR